MLPLPMFRFLVEMDPSLVDLQKITAYSFAGGMAFFGVFLLALWVPYALDSGIDGTAKDRIQMGVSLLIIAAVSLVFGLYVWVPLIIVIVGWIVWVVIKGILIAFGLDTKKHY